MHQQHFATAQTGAVENIAPYREERFRQCRRFHQRKPLWNRQTLCCRCYRVFRIATTIGQSAHLVALLPTLYLCTYLHNLTGHLQPQDWRSTGRRRIETHTLHNIRAVDAGGRHFDQHFIRSRLWPFALGDLHDFRSTVFRQIDVTHKSLNFFRE